jgi:hypothetical protein
MPRNAAICAWLVCLALPWAVSTSLVAARAAEATFELHIERGRVPESMQVIRVKQGDVVKLRWTTDRPIVLHLHGYDIEMKIEPGTVGVMDFVARATGRFPVEVHDSAGGHSHGEAPLARIEVYP